MKRKGQFVSMIAIIALLFISGGSLFTSLFAQETFSQHVNYYSNDANNIADAKMRGELYPQRMEHELNYTFNNAAYYLGSRGGGEDWDRNIPTLSQLESELVGDIFNGPYDIRRQNSILGCASPNIDSSTFNFNGEHNMSYALQEPKIRCPIGAPSRAKLPIRKENGGYSTQEYQVSNKKNNYIYLADYAINLSEKAEDVTPNPLEGTGSEKTSSCEDSDRDATIDDAESSAFSTAYVDIAEDAIDDTSSPSYMEVTSSETEIYGDFVELEGDWEDCTYTVTVSCGSNCTTTETRDSTEYHAKYRFEGSTVHTTFNVKDTENQVPTYSGRENLEFNFEHIYDIP